MSTRTPKAIAMPAGYAGIHGGIVELLDAARQAAARSVNALMTASYWEVGRRIVEAEQQGKRRAGYGEQLIERLSADLTVQFGRGFGVNNLENMRRFFLAYPRSEISQTLSGKLGGGPASENSQTVSGNLSLVELAQVFTLPWSAYVRLLSVKDDHARRFYEAEALRGGWSVRQLDRQIGRHHCIHGWLLNEKGRINTKPPGPAPPSSGTALASRCGCWRSSRPRRQGNVGASTAHNQRCQSISRFIWKIVNTFNVSCSGGVHCGRVVRFLCPHQFIAGHPSDARSLNARVARMSQRGKRVCMTMKRS